MGCATWCWCLWLGQGGSSGWGETLWGAFFIFFHFFSPNANDVTGFVRSTIRARLHAWCSQKIKHPRNIMLAFRPLTRLAGLRQAAAGLGQAQFTSSAALAAADGLKPVGPAEAAREQDMQSGAARTCRVCLSERL